MMKIFVDIDDTICHHISVGEKPAYDLLICDKKKELKKHENRKDNSNYSS